jgi:sigma-E factor negative regulatory protein RseB
MRQTPALFKFIFILFGLNAFSACAENVDAHSEKREVQAWLKRIQTAAQRQNYSGTFVYQQGNQIRTSRITHLLDGRNEVEKLEIMDGRPREYVRHNEEITCYIPETKTLLVEKRVVQDVFPAILGTNTNDLEDYYDLKRGETGRVAGFDCQIIVLEPKDKLRYGYRFWSEKSTGLLLRAQTLNERNEVVEQITFAEIFIGNIDRMRAKPSFVNTNDWRVENAVMSQVNLSGWSVRAIPPGFKKIREFKRMVSDPALPGVQGNSQTTQREVFQIVFSDGLAAISVFIEPGTQSRTEGSMQQGAMNIIGKRQGDSWLTIVGEVPYAAIKQVANSVEFKNSK